MDSKKTETQKCDRQGKRTLQEIKQETYCNEKEWDTTLGEGNMTRSVRH